MHVWSKLASARWVDAWEERILGLGQTNAVISRLPGGKTIRLEVYCVRAADAGALHEQFGGTVRRLRHENWVALANRKQKRRPLKIRDRLVVTHETGRAKIRELEKAFPGRGILSMPAEMAFGTGEHETTATCLRFLADVSGELKRDERGEGGWEMLDLGTGTGILAIAGRVLGAKRVTAFDFDPHAVRVAKANVERHGLTGICVSERNVLEWEVGAGERYDCITANLFSDVLTAIFPAIAAALAPEGRIITSGILSEQAEPCLKSARGAGLRVIEKRVRGKWVTLLLGAEFSLES